MVSFSLWYWLGLPVALLAWLAIGGLRRRVRRLEQDNAWHAEQLALLQTRLELLQAARSHPPEAVAVVMPAATAEVQATAATANTATSEPPPLPVQAVARPRALRHTPASVQEDERDDLAPAAPTFALLAVLKNWFSTGNVPVKVGMLVLLAGVAALLRHAALQGWVQFPVWARLLGVAAAAAGGLVFAWQRRESRRSFALTMQGGCVGVLLLTVFAAYRLFDYWPQGLALAVTLGLLGLTVWLALRQEAVALAVFALLGGFLAPLWLSDGTGSHVLLFGYYALLNGAIFLLAWRKSWPGLNVLGFAFTFGISAVWGAWQYAPAYYASAQFFLALFFGMYLLIPMLNVQVAVNANRTDTPPDWVNGTLVFGTPLAALGLQAALFDGDALRLAAVSAGAALLYGTLAWRFWQRTGWQMLAQAHALLALALGTLAVPLAFSADATACVFALEGMALAWLSLRQHRLLWRFLSPVLFGLAALAWLHSMTGDPLPLPGRGDRAVFNAFFMTTLLLAATLLATAWMHCRWDAATLQSARARLYYAIGLALLLVAGWREIVAFAPTAWEGALLLTLFAALGGVTAWLYQRHWPVPELAVIALGLGMGLPLLHWLLVGEGWFQRDLHPLHGGVLVYAFVSRHVLRRLRDSARMPVPALFDHANALWWLHAVATVFLWLWSWQRPAYPHMLDMLQGWNALLLALPWLMLNAALRFAPQRLGWTNAAVAPSTATAGRQWLQTASILTLPVLAVGMLGLAGRASVLPWLPLLNAQDAIWLACTLLWLAWRPHWPSSSAAQHHAFAWGLACGLGLLGLSKSALAATHHWGGVDWNALALLESALAQTTLTLLWGTLGVAAWLTSSRTANRTLWGWGMALMALVLLKLFLLDRQHLGNLWGIASFIGYGLLCVVVGYIAPSPPARTAVPLTEK